MILKRILNNYFAFPSSLFYRKINLNKRKRTAIKVELREIHYLHGRDFIHNGPLSPRELGNNDADIAETIVINSIKSS